MEQYHILNGDALKERFNIAQPSHTIVVRECLIEGPVNKNTLNHFFDTRAQFIQNVYGSSIEGYKNKVVSEFKKIQQIPKNAEIHLWFEDDVFCQINLYFTLYLIKDQYKLPNKLYLARPNKHTKYGFGGLTNHELAEILKAKTLLQNTTKLISLWKAYQTEDIVSLANISEGLKKETPFIYDTMQAYINSLPTKHSEGAVITCIKNIQQELNTQEFDVIFKEFSKRMPIYGYGDSQLKRILDTIT